MTIKKWSGSAWVDQYVTTNVSNIVASGTPSSTTFLRGDGQWATPTDTNTNNYVSSAAFDGSTLTLNRQGLTALTVDLSSLAGGGGGSGYGLKLSGTITGNQTLESLFESSYDTNGIPDVIGSYWVVTAATANVTFITTAQQHGSGPSIHYCLIADYLEENDATGQFTLEKHDWLMITSYTGSGTGGNPYVVKFSVINNTYTGATATQYGIVKYVSNTAQTQAANSLSAVSGRTYAVQKDANGDMVVNVPWVDTDTNTTYSTFTTTTAGLVPAGGTGTTKYLRQDGTFQVPPDTNTTYSTFTTSVAGLVPAGGTGTTKYLRQDGSFQVPPDTNTDTTYTAGSGLVLTGTEFKVNLISDTAQTVAANTASATASRTYPVQFDSDGDLVVNVPWVDTDTNTTYGLAGTATTGLVRLGAVAANVTVNSVSSTAGRYYPVAASTSGNLYVNVPWVDTNTDTNTVTSIRRDNTGTYRTGNINLVSGTNVTISETSAGVFSFSATDTNTVYTHPTHPGDDINIDTGALSGAVVISDLDFNITTDTLGHVTDANGTIATRTLTLANLGYTGATNANYITNNNQLTNGAGYTTYSANQAVNTDSGPTFAEVYNNGWFRNNQTGEGLYNTASGMHWYSGGGGNWVIRGGEGSMAIQFVTENANTRGYVYADNGNNIGFLTAAGGWRFRIDNSGVLQEGTVPWSRLSSVPTIPTNTNQLTNGAGFVTSSGVTSVATGGGLTGGTITGTGTISHADTSSQGSVNNSGATFIQDVTLDTYGHVTGLASVAITAATIGAAASSHTHSNYLPIAGSPYYSPVANSQLRYNTTYGWLTTAKQYDWNLIRNHTGTFVLDNTQALGTTGGNATVTVGLSAGDVLMMELSPFQSVIAGYTIPIVMVRLGASDTTPTAITQTVIMSTERLNSTTFYEYVVRVSANSTTLYFDDSFRRSYVDTTTAGNIIGTESNNGCFIGKVWRLQV
jgi:hypothetical protein